METESTANPQPTVVGIGASAGGLAALKAFLNNVPPDSGLAFVVVVHLAPHFESHFAELLQPHSRFPLTQVSDSTPIEPNHVYVIPPSANLRAIDTHLRLLLDIRMPGRGRSSATEQCEIWKSRMQI